MSNNTKRIRINDQIEKEINELSLNKKYNIEKVILKKVHQIIKIDNATIKNERKVNIQKIDNTTIKREREENICNEYLLIKKNKTEDIKVINQLKQMMKNEENRNKRLKTLHENMYM